MVIGGGAFVRRMQSLAGGERSEQPEVRWFTRQQADFHEVQRAVERVKRERWEAFVNRHGDWGRDLALWWGQKKQGLSLKTLARHAELGNYRSVTTVIKNFEQRMQRDKSIRFAATQMAQFMNYET